MKPKKKRAPMKIYKAKDVTFHVNGERFDLNTTDVLGEITSAKPFADELERIAERREKTVLEQYESSPAREPGLTMAELHHAYTVAKRVRLQHRIFTHVDFEWEVNAQAMMLMIVVRSEVPSRDDHSSISESEQHDYALRQANAEYLERDREYGTGLASIVGLTIPRVRPPTMLPLRAGLPVHLTRAQCIGDDRSLLAFLAEKARSALINMLTHEIDEMILVDNERKFDPHRDDPDRYTYI